MKTNLAYLIIFFIILSILYIKIYIWFYFKKNLNKNNTNFIFFQEFKPIKFFIIPNKFTNLEYEKKRIVYNFSLFVLILIAIIILFIFNLVILY